MELPETAALVLKSVVPLGSLAVSNPLIPKGRHLDPKYEIEPAARRLLNRYPAMRPASAGQKLVRVANASPEASV